MLRLGEAHRRHIPAKPGTHTSIGHTTTEPWWEVSRWRPAPCITVEVVRHGLAPVVMEASLPSIPAPFPWSLVAFMRRHGSTEGCWLLGRTHVLLEIHIPRLSCIITSLFFTQVFFLISSLFLNELLPTLLLRQLRFPSLPAAMATRRGVTLWPATGTISTLWPAAGALSTMWLAIGMLSTLWSTVGVLSTTRSTVGVFSTLWPAAVLLTSRRSRALGGAPIGTSWNLALSSIMISRLICKLGAPSEKWIWKNI